jgi:hypothetical protein
VVQQGQWFSTVSGSAGSVVQQGQWFSRVSGSAGSVVQQGQWFSRVSGSAGSVVQHGQWFSRVSGSARSVVQHGQWFSRVSGSAGSVVQQALHQLHWQQLPDTCRQLCQNAQYLSHVEAAAIEQYIYLYLYISISISIYLSFYLSIYLSIYIHIAPDQQINTAQVLPCLKPGAVSHWQVQPASHHQSLLGSKEIINQERLTVCKYCGRTQRKSCKLYSARELFVLGMR